MFIRFDMIHERDGRTDRQTLHDRIGRACMGWRGKNRKTGRVIVPAASRKKQVERERLLRTRSTFSKSLTVSVGVCRTLV